MIPGYLEFIQEFNEQFSKIFQNCLATQHSVSPNITALFKQALKISEQGKRVRPYLCWLASSEPLEKVIYIAASLELIHTFALIHDDIIDHSDTRRQEATIHAYGNKLLYQNTHVSQSQALLVGDLILAAADDLFYQNLPSENREELQKTYQSLRHDVVIGQMLDVEQSIQPGNQITETEMLTKTKLKTANYTITQPLQIGALLNKNYQPSLSKFYQEFGLNLGLAFQLQDDLLNLTQPKTITGKPQFSDIQNGQHTIITTHFYEHANTTDQQKLQVIHGQNQASPANNQIIQTLLQETGSLEYAQSRIDIYFQTTKELLTKNSDDKSIPTKQLQDFIDYLANRQA